VHVAIRADPSPAPKVPYAVDKKYKRKSKISYTERKAKIQAKKDAKEAEDDSE
jgi:hypothetical protein